MALTSVSLPRSAVLLAITATIALVACGGDDSDEGGDFLASADLICRDYAERGIDAFASVGEVEGAEDAIALAESQIQVLDGLTGELDGLDVPDDKSDAFAAYIAKIDAAKKGFDDQRSAASKDDQERFQQAAQATDQANLAANDSAEAVGLTACAERLSDDAEAQVREVITRTGTSDDPVQCEEDYTTRFVEGSFGGLAECERQQESGEQTPADSVEIDELHGYDELVARATVTPTGGDLDGQTVMLTLAYEDGRWKVDGAQAADGSQ